MSQPLPSVARRAPWIHAWPFYYGWINVVVASVAMTATLPGRTHGLGLITEPLLADLRLDRLIFARLNLASALLGALFALPVGWMIDRWGTRRVLVAVTLALGLSVLGMSRVETSSALLATLILVRGFGQSALSVVSIAAIGKWFKKRLGAAMGAFAVLLTFGFIASVLAMGGAIEQWGWRQAWHGMGLALLALVPLFWLFARSTPESCGLAMDLPGVDSRTPASATAFSLRAALRTPSFWIVVLGSGIFNLAWSGVTLFNESMIAERGLERSNAVEIMAILTGAGLIANLLAGGLATRSRILPLLAAGMGLLASALAIFPSIDSVAGARLYATAIGLSGGAITVVFFAAWGHLFGRTELGRIQGVAQLATVLASAAGPLLMAQGRDWTGSYSATFYTLAALTALVGAVALVTPLPAIAEGEFDDATAP